MSKLLTVLASLSLGTLGACVPYYAGNVNAGGAVVTGPVAAGPAWGPDLMWAAPGVQVAAGWDQPVFFVDDSWWWWNDGAWMWWGPSGWMWAQPPVVLTTHIREPWRYRGWGAPGHVAQRGWTRDHRGVGHGRAWTRDHRGSVHRSPARAGGGRGAAPARSSPPRSGGRSWGGGATVRDHRRR